MILLFILFFLIYLFLNAYENYAREKWREGYDYKRWSNVWHSIQSIRWIVVLVYIVYLTFDFKNLIILLPLSAIWKVFYDGYLNFLRGYNFWRVSEHKDLSFWEKYSTPTNKLLYLLLTIVVCFVYYQFILPML